MQPEAGWPSVPGRAWMDGVFLHGSRKELDWIRAPGGLFRLYGSMIGNWIHGNGFVPESMGARKGYGAHWRQLFCPSPGESSAVCYVQPRLLSLRLIQSFLGVKKGHPGFRIRRRMCPQTSFPSRKGPTVSWGCVTCGQKNHSIEEWLSLSDGGQALAVIWPRRPAEPGDAHAPRR